jgi:3-deoxy-D-manno-octulosonic-acid transferase
LIWNIGYAILLLLLAPWLLYRRFTTGRYRDRIAERFWGSLSFRLSKGPAIWIHAVSVGEVQVAASFAEALRHKWPNTELYVTTATQTGFALARRRFPHDTVSYAPLDFTWAIRRAFHRIRPSLILLVELEVWPNWIRTAKRLGVPVAVINGRLSPRSFRGYQRLRSMLRSTFAKLDLVAAQDPQYAARFSQLGTPAERVHVTGSLKFDGAVTDRNHPRITELLSRTAFQKEDVVWVVGSTQAPEEEIALEIFRELRHKYPQLRLVLVPRHPERFDEVAQLLDHARIPYVRWTKLSSPLTLQPEDGHPVLLIDTVGDLRFWWGIAKVAFVGGSLSQRGGQNMIEPAAYGAAVCFGPNTINFRDVVEHLLEAQGAVVVEDGPALREFIDNMMSDLEAAEQLGQRAKAVVERHGGATDRTLQLLEHLAGGLLEGNDNNIPKVRDSQTMGIDGPQNRTGPKGIPTRSDAVRS